MMEVPGGSVISPHERDHAGDRQDKQTEKNQSRHDYSLGSENRHVKDGLTALSDHDKPARRAPG